MKLIIIAVPQTEQILQASTPKPASIHITEMGPVLFTVYFTRFKRTMLNFYLNLYLSLILTFYSVGTY